MASIANLIEDDKTQITFVHKAIPAVRFELKTIGKAGVAWLLKQDAGELAEGYEDVIKQASDKSIDATVEALIKEHQGIGRNIEAPKQALADIAKGSPLIVFIDELDRCRPHFAVAILEHIKHVFDIDGVHFVLVANRGQLRSSINHCYGLGVDAKRYLDKFVKFTFQLTQEMSLDDYSFTRVSVAHVRRLVGERELLSELAAPAYQEVIEALIRQTTCRCGRLRHS